MHVSKRGNTTIVALLAVVIVAGGLIVFMGDDATPQAATDLSSRNAATELVAADSDRAIASDEVAMTDEVTMKDEDISDNHSDDIMDDSMEKTDMMDEPLATADAQPLAAGTFSDYSEDKLALAEDGDVFIFFHASWCPSCKALEADINANLSAIPSNLHILKADYDTETDLKVQYGVTRQHTLVKVDAAGNQITTLPGSILSLEQITAAI